MKQKCKEVITYYCNIEIKVDQKHLKNPYFMVNNKNPFKKKIDQNGFLSLKFKIGFYKKV